MVLHLPQPGSCCLRGSRACCMPSCWKELPVSMENAMALGRDIARVMPGWKCWRCRLDPKRSHPPCI